MEPMQKRLRKVKALFDMLNKQNRAEAERRASENWFGSACYTVFDFTYGSDDHYITLAYWRYRLVMDSLGGFDIELDDSICERSHGNLIDCASPRNFGKGKYHHTSNAVRFVRKALKRGMGSMSYGHHKIEKNVTNYLDFTDKESK